MKHLVVLLCFAVASCVPIEKSKLDEFERICIQESGMDKATLVSIRAGGKMPPKDDKICGFLACWARKMNYLDESGKVSYDVIKEELGYLFDEKETKKIMETCWKEGESLGETVYLLYDCFSKEIKKRSLAGKS